MWEQRDSGFYQQIIVTPGEASPEKSAQHRVSAVKSYVALDLFTWSTLTLQR